MPAAQSPGAQPSANHTPCAHVLWAHHSPMLAQKGLPGSPLGSQLCSSSQQRRAGERRQVR